MIFTGSYPLQPAVQSRFFSLLCYAKVPEIVLISSAVSIYHTLFLLALADTAACKKEGFHSLLFCFSSTTTWVKVEAESQLNMQQSHCTSTQVSDLCLGRCMNQPFQIKATGFPNELSLKLI